MAPRFASESTNGPHQVLFICIENCCGPECRDGGLSRPGAQAGLLSLPNVLIELATGFYLILLLLLRMNRRHDAQRLSPQQPASGARRPHGTAPVSGLRETQGSPQVTDPPFLHSNCNGWGDRGARPRGQQPRGRRHGQLSPCRPSALPGSPAFLGYGFSAETSRRVNLAGRPSPSCTIPAEFRLSKCN